MIACPPLARIRSVKIFNVVVLPAPLGPRNPTHFAPSIFKFRFERATNEPYRLVRSRASIEDNSCTRSPRVKASLFQDIPRGITVELLFPSPSRPLLVSVTGHPFLLLGIGRERICY